MERLKFGTRLAGKFDRLRTSVSLEKPTIFRSGIARELFHFHPVVQQFPKDKYLVEIHPRSSADLVGFILPTVQVGTLTEEREIIKTKENIKEERLLNTRVFNKMDIFHLYDGKGNLVIRITAEEIANHHKRLTEEELQGYLSEPCGLSCLRRLEDGPS